MLKIVAKEIAVVSEANFTLEVMYMCQFSATAENSRDARQGEDLTVTPAPHGGSNWLTEKGKSEVAVCIPNTGVLAVQLPNQPVRGATFEQAKLPDAAGNRDFLNFLDNGERVPLNSLPKKTNVRVLHLHAVNLNGAAPTIPVVIGTSESEQELVGVATGGARGMLNRLLDRR